jgi:hypothetical protein
MKDANTTIIENIIENLNNKIKCSYVLLASKQACYHSVQNHLSSCLLLKNKN